MHWSAKVFLLALVVFCVAVSEDSFNVLENDEHDINFNTTAPKHGNDQHDTDTDAISLKNDDDEHEVDEIPRVSNASRNGFGDFVKLVVCHASGMDIELQSVLPKSISGVWNLEVEDHPDCPNACMKNVGAGYKFTIYYADRYLCGVEPISYFTPPWVSYAQVTLLLKDDNITLADSISCLYNTRVEASVITFDGQVTNEELRYSGTVDEEGTDIEGSLDASQSINMEFFDEYNKALGHKNVRLGEPIKLTITVADDRKVQQILPETCYFSSSSVPDESPRIGHTLTFIRKSCFNDKNPMVRAILPKMDRSADGRRYELHFPAFHFAKFGHNLYVHCTIIACVGNDKQCEPRPQCFGSNRKKRALDTRTADAEMQQRNREVQMSRVLVVGNGPEQLSAEIMAISGTSTVCLHYGLMVALALAAAFVLLMMLTIIAWLIRKQSSGRKSKVLSGTYSNGTIGPRQVDISKL